MFTLKTTKRQHYSLFVYINIKIIQWNVDSINLIKHKPVDILRTQCTILTLYRLKVQGEYN